MRHRLRTLAVALLLSAAAIGPALAQSDYPFRLHNRSQGWTIVGFQTYQGGSWSRNWLDSPVQAGDFDDMDWNSNAGDCVVRFRVNWRDYGPTEHRADFCRLRNLYMLNEGFRWD